MEYNRIIIVGSPGSGKSYFSKRIAAVTGYPLFHLDNEYWQPNWVGTPRNEWIEKQQSIIGGAKWIIDGNYDSTLELRYEAADLIIDLNINRYLCMWSAVKRHGKKRSDFPTHCVEKIDKEFVDFLKFIWKFPIANRKKIIALRDQYPNKAYIEMKSRRQASQWIKMLEA